MLEKALLFMLALIILTMVLVGCAPSELPPTAYPPPTEEMSVAPEPAEPPPVVPELAPPPPPESGLEITHTIPIFRHMVEFEDEDGHKLIATVEITPFMRNDHVLLESAWHQLGGVGSFIFPEGNFDAASAVYFIGKLSYTNPSSDFGIGNAILPEADIIPRFFDMEGSGSWARVSHGSGGLIHYGAGVRADTLIRPNPESLNKPNGQWDLCCSQLVSEESLLQINQMDALIF